jgi:hypothetical protein
MGRKVTDVVLNVRAKYHLEERLMTVTANNASNNSMLCQKL